MNGCLVGFIMGFEEVSGDRSLFSFCFFFLPFYFAQRFIRYLVIFNNNFFKKKIIIFFFFTHALCGLSNWGRFS